MNVRKKFAMLAFVIALAMSFCVMASATALPSEDVAKNYAGLSELTFTVKLADTVANTPRPGTKFTYTVAAGNNNADGAPTVAFNTTQSDGQVAVDNGSAVVTFPVANNGADATATVSLSITDAATPATKGTFSYTITQAALSTEATTAGFKSTATDGAAVVYTLKLAVNDQLVTQAALYSDVENNIKVAGFETNTYTAAGDVEVTKYVVRAGSADKDAYFDFNITIPASSSGDVITTGLNITFATTDDANTTSGKTGFQNGTQALSSGSNTIAGVLKAADGGTNEGAIDVAISTGNTLSIKNLPGGVQVTVAETYAYNNDGYTVKTSSKANESYGTLSNAKGDTDDGTTLTTAVGSDVGVKYFNILEEVSLTGVTLRYAPYLLTLGAGVTVLPLSRRYKKREDEV